MNEIISSRLHEKLASLSLERNSVVILKGIPLNFVGDGNFPEDLERAVRDPLKYFFELTTSGRKFLTYEEFLLLNAFIFTQYNSVYVVNNSLFMKQYPIEDKFGNATKQNLLEHFAEPDNDSTDPQAQKLSPEEEKFTNIFVGLKELKGFLIGVYNDEQILNKVTIINLFDKTDAVIEEIDSSNAPDIIDLKKETDYADFVRQIISATPDKIFVRTCNYTDDKDRLDAYLKIVAAQIKISTVLPEEITLAFKPRAEFAEILKRHWGYDDFKNFRVYDRQKLYTYDKTTEEVSQEKIISDIVEQVEHCRKVEDFRDVFVTAPTGAGKSVIFQVAAIYLAEKYGLLTIVISPLIALMNDQVQKFKLKDYQKAQTINSETSPITKDQIIKEIADGECDILYISPETLMSRNDIEQLIGDREIGLIAIDEAHIVSTWGKEFRPDYWYMSDRIKKMRKKYSFIIATFTATAIYRGPEDMYWKIIDMLYMNDPITYLGYVKRDDIDIVIDRSPLRQKDKSNDILKTVQEAGLFSKKTLIYFPWVKLLNEAFNKLGSHNHSVATYHAKLFKNDKQTSLNQFGNGQAWVIMATKAFGMGIDIDDIQIVMHFAPTGNVCDYVQEIGRAARRDNLRGEARYHYASSDFKYVKFFHRMAINKYQLINVMKKICEVYRRNPKNNLVLDAENFSYIFYNSEDEDDTINKVKIALLIIQKDFETKLGFPPIFSRPCPLYSKGFFEIAAPSTIQTKYGGITEIDSSATSKNIYCVNLKHIWENNFRNETFPQFKRRIYSKDNNLPAELQTLWAAYIVTIDFKSNFKSTFDKLFGAFESTVRNIYTKNLTNNSVTIDDLSKEFAKVSDLPNHKAQNICEIFIASMESYQNKVFTRRSDKETISFNSPYFQQYFRWFKDTFNEIDANTVAGKFYMTGNRKEYAAVFGILEAMGVLNFDITGGSNNQICLHINQIGVLENAIRNQNGYSNKILNEMNEQRKISLEMLEYIYENPLNSAMIWDLLEDYFLGKIPNAVRNSISQKFGITI